MHLAQAISFRRNFVRRSIVPAILLFFWIISAFWDLAWGQSWHKGFTRPLPEDPRYIVSGDEDGEWSIRTGGGSLTVVWGSDRLYWDRGAPPSPLTTATISECKHRECNIYELL